jgi:hypothetical protein
MLGLVCAILANTSVWAQSNDGAAVFRCGNSYSTKPCPNGSVVDAADPRNAAQVRDAREAAQRDAALAAKMAAERRAAEKDASKGKAVNVGPEAAKPPKPAASKAAGKPKKPKHGKKKADKQKPT